MSEVQMARQKNNKDWNREPEAPNVQKLLSTFKCKNLPNCGEEFEAYQNASTECPFCGSTAIEKKEE